MRSFTLGYPPRHFTHFHFSAIRASRSACMFLLNTITLETTGSRKTPWTFFKWYTDHWKHHLQQPLPLPEVSLVSTPSAASPSPRGLTGIHTFSSLSLSQRPHWCPHFQQPLPLPEASLVSTPSTASPSPRGLTGVHTFNRLSLSQRPHWCPHLQQPLPLPQASLVSTPSTGSPSPRGLKNYWVHRNTYSSCLWNFHQASIM